MVKIAEPVLILYIVASLLGFCFRFFKDGVWKTLSVNSLLEKLPVFGLVLLPFVCLLLLGQQLGVAAGTTLPYFLGAAGVSYLVGSIGLPTYLRGILLLAVSVAFTLCVSGADNLMLVAAGLLGFLAGKLTDNVVLSPDSSFDDILPPFIWLSAISWISTADSGDLQKMHASIILGVISVSLLMRFVQGPIAKINRMDDRIYLKRIMLSVTAGLAILCILVKLLNEMSLQPLAGLCAAGYFTVYLLKDMDAERRYVLNAKQSITVLVVVGLLTLLATRFYGTFGLLALAPVSMVAPLSSMAILPGIFWASRALLQVYIQNFNTNVTGVNLTHAYAGAAMYAGFLLPVVLLLVLREIADRRVLLSIILGVGIVSPVMSNYLLHAEPTASLFISALVAATLLAAVAPSLQERAAKGTENLMLMPGLMITSGLLTHGLLEAGVESTISLKTSVLGYGIAIVLILMAVYWWLSRRVTAKPAAGNG